MSDTRAAIEQFAALFAAVQKLAEIEDVEKAAAAAGQADELLNGKRAEIAEQNQLLTAVREEVAAERKKLEDTRKALLTLQRLLGSAPQAA